MSKNYSKKRSSNQRNTVSSVKSRDRYNSVSSSKSHSKYGSRKKQSRKLNYRKIFLCLIILGLIIYFCFSGIPKIFSRSSSKNNTAVQATSSESVKQDPNVNIAVIGDIMSHSSNIKDAYNSDTDTYDYSYVFTDINHYIQDADLAIGNLETTFAGKDAVYSGYPNFNTPEALAKNLKDLGIDVVSTANNHSLDKRYAGLVSTLDELDKVGIAHTGTYRSTEEQNTITTKNVNGINFAFLSFTYGTNGIPVPSGKEYCINLIDEDLILDQISKAKALNPDVLCVSMHWGEEYKLKQNSTQEKLADFLFKNGVDIIFGCHPHVLQPMEKRTVTLEDGTTKDGFVIYSLGNFMSGQVAENTTDSIILQLKLTKHLDTNKITIDSYQYVPIYMYHTGTSQNVNYKILDINKSISDYESGNSEISENLYETLKKTKKKIEGIF
ncbi:MAG: CapA family protein [Clostridia bacterium]|nr:CapA family protein [Clostridia bacterium]